MPEHDVQSLAGHDPAKSWVARLIAWSVRNQLIIVMLAAALGLAGAVSMQKTPLDAIPDLTDTQVIIRTDFEGQAPKIVEDLVTYPLSRSRLGRPLGVGLRPRGQAAAPRRV